MHRHGPVSYTHLDVYKRQVKNLLEIFLIELVRRHKFEPVDYLPKTKLTKMNMNTMYEDLARAVLAYFEEHLCETIRTEDPVSYTHLDVYKRQVVHHPFHRG